MKKLIFPILLLMSFPLMANPRNTYPESPDEIYQNDTDLRDMIESRIKKVDGFPAIGNLADGTTTYLRIDAESGAPPAGDCNNNSERGRMVLDFSGGVGAYKLYICTGATDGWDTLTLTD